VTKAERIAQACRWFGVEPAGDRRRIPITNLQIRTLGQTFEIGDAWIEVGSQRLNGTDAASFPGEVIDTEGVEVP
jgi:hypothetical protein